MRKSKTETYNQEIAERLNGKIYLTSKRGLNTLKTHSGKRKFTEKR